MASNVRIEHIYEVGEDTFWGTVFLDEEYNRRLYLEGLKFESYELKSQDESDSEVKRSIDLTPRLGDLPGPMKKVLGDNLSYLENGVYDKSKRRYHVDIVPSTLPNKIKVTGDLWTEAVSDQQCRRIFEARVEVKVLGLGKLMEKRIVDDLQKGYSPVAGEAGQRTRRRRRSLARRYDRRSSKRSTVARFPSWAWRPNRERSKITWATSCSATRSKRRGTPDECFTTWFMAVASGNGSGGRRYRDQLTKTYRDPPEFLSLGGVFRPIASVWGYREARLVRH